MKRMGLLNRIGIGSAEVDTILDTETVQPGDSIPARIEIEGGSDDQTVDDIELAVMTRYEVETDEGTSYRNVAITETELTNGFTIEAGEERTMDAGEIRVPETTPPTLGKTEVWVQTGLDIDWSVDPTDKDVLDVRPGPYLSALTEAVEGLGFRLSEVETVKASGFGPHEFAQEFEYRPTSGSRYASDLDEIELFPVRQSDSLSVVVEVDKAGVSLLGSDESHHRLTIDTTDPDHIASQISRLIDEQL
jgi:sporulation-control protein